MHGSFEVERPQVRGAGDDVVLGTAAAHERAAMLAEFNGTYELARHHRELAERLRREATDAED